MNVVELRNGAQVFNASKPIYVTIIIVVVVICFSSFRIYLKEIAKKSKIIMYMYLHIAASFIIGKFWIKICEACINK